MKFFVIILFLISCATEPKKEILIDEKKEIISEIKNLFIKEKFLEAEQKIQFIKNDSIENLELKAKIYFQNSKFEKAEECYKKNLEQEKSEINYLKYFIFLTKIGKNLESNEVIRELISISQNNPIYLFKYAMILKKENLISQSQNTLTSIENYPNQFQLNLHIADNYYLLKNYTLAEKFFLKAKQYGSLNEEENEIFNSIKYILNINRSIELAKKEDFEEAIKELLEAEKISEKEILPKFTLGNIYLKKKDYKNAEKYFQKTILLKPNFKDSYINLAKLYFEKEEFENAKKILDESEKKFPKEFEIFNLKGMYYFKTEDFKKASIQFLKSIEFNPKEFNSRYNLILIYILENRFSEASFELDKLKINFPNNKELIELNEYLESEKNEIQFLNESEVKEYQTEKIDILESLALYHFHKKNFIMSEKYFLKLNEKSDSMEYKYYLARIYNLTNNPKKEKFSGLPFILGVYLEDEEKYFEVIEYYKKRSIKKNKISEIYLKLAKSEYEKNNLIESEKFLNLAKEYEYSKKLKSFEMELFEKKETNQFKEANQLYKEKKYKKALNEYLKILLKKNNLFIRKKIILCFKKLNEFENAIEFLKNSIQEDKSSSINYKTELGKIYSETKNYYSAINTFEEVLKENPDEEKVYSEIGLIYLEFDFFKAKINFDKSLNLNPKNSKSYLGRGIAKYRLGSRDESKHDFEKSIFYSKNKEQAKLNLGILFLNEFNLDEAEKIFLELNSQNPKNYFYPYYLSLIEYKKENFKNSESWILRSIGLGRNKENLLAYQKILTKLENFTEQKKVETEILEKFPELVLNKNSEKINLRENLNLKPLFYQNTLILNYKNSIEAYEIDKKKNKWRIELEEKILKLEIGDEIYIQTESSIYKLNSLTGEEILNLNKQAKEIHSHQFGFYLEYNDKIESYDKTGKLIEKFLNKNKYSVFVNELGKILISKLGDREIQFKLYDSSFNLLNEFELIGPNILSFQKNISLKNEFYFKIENSIYQLNDKGIIKILELTEDYDFFKINDKIYLLSKDKIFYLDLEHKKIVLQNIKFKNNKFEKELIFSLIE